MESIHHWPYIWGFLDEPKPSLWQYVPNEAIPDSCQWLAALECMALLSFPYNVCRRSVRTCIHRLNEGEWLGFLLSLTHKEQLWLILDREPSFVVQSNQSSSWPVVLRSFPGCYLGPAAPVLTAFIRKKISFKWIYWLLKSSLFYINSIDRHGMSPLFIGI